MSRDAPNMAEVQAAESKASMIQSMNKSADGMSVVEGQDIDYIEEGYMMAANEVKYEAQQAQWDALPPEGDGPFDLAVALRLPSGTPAVIFLSPEDDFGLAVISEQLFSELREKERLPIYSSALIASAPRETWLRIYQGEDQLNAYYINVL